MAQSKTRGEATPNYTPKWVAVAEWEGFAKGDRVVVTSDFAEPRAKWEFVEAHIKGGKAIAVVVIGGLEGRRAFRAFRPEAVSQPNAPKRRGRLPQGEAFAKERAEALKAQRAERRAATVASNSSEDDSE